MDIETLQKAEQVGERIHLLRMSIKPIQRRVEYLKKKVELQPDNYFIKSELEALGLCWKLLNEEIKRLRIFNSYLTIEGDTDDNGTNESH